MAEIPRTARQIKDFRGMATNPDPTDLQPGIAELQINCNGYRRGQIEVRRGLREVTFEDDE